MIEKFNTRIPLTLRTYLACNAKDFSPLTLHAPSYIGAIATVLGRRVYLRQGSSQLFPNDFIMIVGNPGTGKSWAISTITRFLKAAGYKNFAPEKVTIQQLFKEFEIFQHQGFPVTDKIKRSFDWMNDPEKVPAEMLIAASEMGLFLSYGENTRELIATLNQLYDCLDSFEYKTVKGTCAYLYQPLLNVIAGTTPSDFQAMFGHGAASGGLMSRFLMVAAFDTIAKQFEPPTPDMQLVEQVVSDLQAAMQLSGEAQFTTAGYELAKTIHEMPAVNAEGALQHFYARRDTRRKKMAMSLAAMRGTLQIDIDDVILAHTLICYYEMHLPKVLGEHGTASNSGASQKIMQALYSANKPMSSKEIMSIVSTDVPSIEALKTALFKLEEAGKLQKVDGSFLPVSSESRYKMDKYVDWELLRGIIPDEELDALTCKKAT